MASIADMVREKQQLFEAYANKMADIIHDRLEAIRFATGRIEDEPITVSIRVYRLQPERVGIDICQSGDTFTLNDIYTNESSVKDQELVGSIGGNTTTLSHHDLTAEDVLRIANRIIAGFDDVPLIKQTEIGFNPNKLALAGSKDIWLAVQTKEILDESARMVAEKLGARAILFGLVTQEELPEIISKVGAVNCGFGDGVQITYSGNEKELEKIDPEGLLTCKPYYEGFKELARAINGAYVLDGKHYKIDVNELPKLPTAEKAAGQAKA